MQKHDVSATFEATDYQQVLKNVAQKVVLGNAVHCIWHRAVVQGHDNTSSKVPARTGEHHKMTSVMLQYPSRIF